MKKKNNKIILLIAIIILIALIAIIATSFNTKETNTIKIGFITGITGSTAYIGEPDYRAVLLAEKKIKEIYGDDSFNLIIEDSKSDAKEAATAANKLINIDNVDAIFVEFTGPSGAVVPIGKDNDVFVLYSAYTTDPLTKNETAVKTYRHSEAECEIFAKLAQEKGIEKIAILDGTGGTMPYDCQKGTLKYYTEENIKIENLVGVTDIKTVLLKLNNQGYTGLFSCLFENTTISVLSAQLELNIKNMTFYGDSANTFTDKIISTIGIENLEGIVVSSLKFSDSFLSDYDKEYGNTTGITGNAPTDYDGILMLFSAIKKCGDDKSCITLAMLNDKVEGTVITYNSPIGRSLNPVVDYFIIENGNLVPLDIP